MLADAMSRFVTLELLPSLAPNLQTARERLPHCGAYCLAVLLDKCTIPSYNTTAVDVGTSNMAVV